MTFYSNKCLYLCVDTLYTRVCILCSERSIYQPLFARVCRTAAPLQLLMLLLLGAAWLLPLIQRCDDAYDCRLINNIRQTFDVVLTYPDGSPPVWMKTHLQQTYSWHRADAATCARIDYNLQSNVSKPCLLGKWYSAEKMPFWQRMYQNPQEIFCTLLYVSWTLKMVISLLDL